MTQHETVSKIKSIIVRVLDIDTDPNEIQDENLIEAYGLNSVDALEILMHIEKEFDISIDEEDLTAELVNSAHGLAAYITARSPAS